MTSTYYYLWAGVAPGAAHYITKNENKRPNAAGRPHLPGSRSPAGTAAVAGPGTANTSRVGQFSGRAVRSLGAILLSHHRARGSAGALGPRWPASPGGPQSMAPGWMLRTGGSRQVGE